MEVGGGYTGPILGLTISIKTSMAGSIKALLPRTLETPLLVLKDLLCKGFGH